MEILKAVDHVTGKRDLRDLSCLLFRQIFIVIHRDSSNFFVENLSIKQFTTLAA